MSGAGELTKLGIQAPDANPFMRTNIQERLKKLQLENPGSPGNIALQPKFHAFQ